MVKTRIHHMKGPVVHSNTVASSQAEKVERLHFVECLVERYNHIKITNCEFFHRSKQIVPVRDDSFL
jgi:hypothetical protein